MIASIEIWKLRQWKVKGLVLARWSLKETKSEIRQDLPVRGECFNSDNNKGNIFFE